jgi:hypothetical protein
MSRVNFNHVNQFARNGHQPLPKSKPEYGGYWHDSESVSVGYPNNGLDSIAGVEMITYKAAGGSWHNTAKGLVVSFEKASNVGKSLPMGRYSYIIACKMIGDMLEQHPASKHATRVLVMRGNQLYFEYRIKSNGLRFRKKETIPLGIDEDYPLGNPDCHWRDLYLGGEFISAAEHEFYHKWLHSIIRGGVYGERAGS